MADEFTVDTTDTSQSVKEFERTPKGAVARWLAELEMADEEEREFRKEANESFKIYEGDEQKAFNILWSNTETVLPTVYNSTPEPDVRRRFRDPDPVGKVASKVTERSLSYSVDVYPFNDEVNKAVLDAELTGRGILRNVYKPTFGYMEQVKPTLWSRIKSALGVDAKPQQVLVDERVELIHVQWDKFRRGPGATWGEVPWISFEHAFTRDMADEEFGEKIGKALKYNEVKGAEMLTDKTTKEARSLFRTCIVHEIYDRVSKRILWIAPCYKDKPVKQSGDELQLDGFFPMPPPLYSIFNSKSLIPRSRYRMYKKQAETLETISQRIDKMVKTLRLRGAYASNLPELKEMMDAQDGELIAVQNVSAVMDSGGLDKMIWIMPIDRLKSVLEALIIARNECKQAIYEIVGLSDIVRGATDPNETLGAQQLKSQYSSIRLEKYQREVQRVVRDGMRIMADMICSRFSPQTLQAITQIRLPTAQEKQQAQQQIQMAQMQAQQQQQPGAPPQPQQEPPEELKGLLEMPTWEDVIKLLKADFLRSTRIDIETDSTVAETVNRDMQGINETLDVLGKFLTGAQALVQSGMMPVEAAKQIAINITRRTRMGQVVEDSFEGMQQPAPDAPAQADDGGAQKAVMAAESKAQTTGIQLQEEKSQRAIDKREMDLKLREQEIAMREDQLKQTERQVQEQARQVQQASSQLQSQLSTIQPPGDPMQGAPNGALMS